MYNPWLVVLSAIQVSIARETLNTNHPSYELFTANVSSIVKPNLKQFQG